MSSFQQAGTTTSFAKLSAPAGFFRNAAKKDPQEGYKTLVEGTPVYIHPSSALFNRNPEWLVYQELVLTTREYCHNVTAVESKWFVEVAPQLLMPIRSVNARCRRRLSRCSTSTRSRMNGGCPRSRGLFVWYVLFNSGFIMLPRLILPSDSNMWLKPLGRVSYVRRRPLLFVCTCRCNLKVEIYSSNTTTMNLRSQR